MAIVRSETIAFRLLNNALRSKKIAQVYLFYGGDTETRKDTALAFLAGVIGGRDALPEENDPLYQRLRSGTCADFYYLSGRDETLKTDQLKDLIRELQRTALEATGRKGYLIENINNSSDKVYNQILKFMEETPGENTFGVLLSDHIDSLLPTIVSRCERIPFPKADRRELKSLYLADGFEESDARVLSEITDVYRKRGLNDPAYLGARDLFASVLEEDLTSLPVRLNRDFFPRFAREDRSVLIDSLQLYASLLNQGILQDGSFLPEEEKRKICSLSQKEKKVYIESAQEVLRYLNGPLDLKLLMDHHAYCLLRKEV